MQKNTLKTKFSNNNMQLEWTLAIAFFEPLNLSKFVNIIM